MIISIFEEHGAVFKPTMNSVVLGDTYGTHQILRYSPLMGVLRKTNTLFVSVGFHLVITGTILSQSLPLDSWTCDISS